MESTAETKDQAVNQLEMEAQPQEEAVSPPFFDEVFRWKVTYLFSGAVILAVWWLVYSNLLAFSRLITYHVFQLREGTHFGATVEFFLFEVPKVMLLLTLIVFFLGVIRSFFTPERTRKILAGSGESVGHFLAALLAKGAAFGTVLAFMMAVIAISTPEAIILRKVLNPTLLGAFIGVVTAGIIMVGYIFNIVL
jgi:uncharacterized membrane protein YraQ (UPF0718 family)